MDSISTVVFALLLICMFQMTSSKPIVDPALPSADFETSSELVVSQFEDPNQREEADVFMRSNGVTQEEIDEYHRISGFNPPVEQMGDERIFGLGQTLKFWNWSMFDRFRQWITGRRQTTTTNHSLLFINQFERPSYNQH